MPRFSLLILVLFGLIGCASGPALEATSRGTLPAGGTQAFGMDTAEDAGPEGRAALQAVARALSSRGFREDPATPQWRVEAIYAERPRSLGAFTQDAAPEDGEAWRISPTPRRWWRRDDRMRVLTVRISDAQTGAELVQAVAEGRIDRDSSGPGVEELARAATTAALAGTSAASR